LDFVSALEVLLLELLELELELRLNPEAALAKGDTSSAAVIAATIKCVFLFTRSLGCEFL
jgi:hypothetical protein